MIVKQLESWFLFGTKWKLVASLDRYIVIAWYNILETIETKSEKCLFLFVWIIRNTTPSRHPDVILESFDLD